MRIIAGLGCRLLLAGCGGSASSNPPEQPEAPQDCRLSEDQQAMLAAVNAARSQPRSCGSRNLAPAPALRWSCRLALAAERHAQDMANHDLLSHTSTDGLQVGERVTATGYRWQAVGENIAAGQRSVAEVMQDWLQSAGHCANIMNPLHAELGAAAAVSGTDARIYWAQVFARPREP